MKRLLKIIIALAFASNTIQAQSTKCLMVESVTTKDGNPVFKITQTFDKHDNLLSKETIQYMGSVEVSSKVVNEYDAQNRLVKKQSFFNNSLTKTTVKQYNSLGKLTASNESNGGKNLNSTTFTDNTSEQVFYNENGSVSSKETYEKQGNTEKTTHFETQNNITSIDIKVFSVTGKVIENQHDDVLGKVNQTFKSQYDSKDVLQKQEEFVNGELKGYTVYQYTGKLLSKQIRFTKNDLEDYRLEFSYDAAGNQTQTLSYYRNALASKQTKAYDEKNNLILETNFDKDGQKINETTYKYNCK